MLGRPNTAGHWLAKVLYMTASWPIACGMTGCLWRLYAYMQHMCLQALRLQVSHCKQRAVTSSCSTSLQGVPEVSPASCRRS
jgi:hypothetical protein